MGTIAEIYTKAVYGHLKPLYANWEPGRPVALGDYGLLSGRMFVHLGNIGAYGISPKEVRDGKADCKSFSSARDTEVRLTAKGDGSVRASIEISFGNRDSVFFNAAECVHSMIEDKVALGREVMKLLRQEIWNRDWVVVTDLIRAGATTVAISEGNGSSLVLDASDSEDEIDLTNASIALGVRSSNNVGFCVVAQHGLTPLLGLCKVQRAGLVASSRFNPILRRGVTFPPEGDDSHSLFFGQLE